MCFGFLIETNLELFFLMCKKNHGIVKKNINISINNFITFNVAKFKYKYGR